MNKQKSDDFRRMVAIESRTHGIVATAKKYKVSPASVTNYRRKFKDTPTETNQSRNQPVSKSKTPQQFTMEVPIPTHILQKAVAEFLTEKLGIKIVQF